MDLKKLGKALLFPHIAIMIILIPIATVLLVGSMVFIGTESVIAYISYPSAISRIRANGIIWIRHPFPPSYLDNLRNARHES